MNLGFEVGNSRFDQDRIFIQGSEGVTKSLNGKVHKKEVLQLEYEPHVVLSVIPNDSH